MLDAGKLRHKLTILSPVSEQDSDTGEMDITWYVLGKFWGSFEPYSTKDVIAAGTLEESTEARAIIRYNENIASGMRVLFRNRIYNIVGHPLPDPDSGLEYMTVMLHQLDSGDFDYEDLPDGGVLKTRILFAGPTTLTTNGILTSFTFDNSFLSGSLQVTINGVHATPGDEYTEKSDNTGIDFTSAPASDDVAEIMYAYPAV